MAMVKSAVRMRLATSCDLQMLLEDFVTAGHLPILHPTRRLRSNEGWSKFVSSSVVVFNGSTLTTSDPCVRRCELHH